MKIQSFFKKPLRLLFYTSLIVTTIYLSYDYNGPLEIPLKPDTAFGFSCLRAKELIVQEYDRKGNLWATRGMIIYQQKKGDNKFIRFAHIPTGYSFFWLRNFFIMRKLTIRPECIEMVVTDKGDICALSGGKMWTLSIGSNEFKETLKLDHYNFGDQGIRNEGIIDNGDNNILWGEYYRNPNLDKVRIFQSANNMSSWQVAYEFQPGQIRHIHAIQKDPYSDKLWLCTGDIDGQQMIAYSENKFKSIKIIGNGNAKFRACQLVFTKEALFWATDTDIDSISGLYRLDRNTLKIEKLYNTEGAVFFGTRLANGTIVMSTDREGFKNETSEKTSLIILSEDKKITTIQCGTRHHKTPPFWNKYAMLRFQRDQGAPSIAITILNQKEFPDGELVIISEENLISVASLKSNQLNY